MPAPILALLLLACVQRPREAGVDERRRQREEVAASEARALRGPDLSKLDATTSTDTLAPGLIHHALRFAEGPWAVHVLDVDLRACWSPVAVKAGGGAVGRARTTELLESLLTAAAATPSGEQTAVAAGVNADFFRFSPPGVPVAAHVQRGRVIAGPSRRPVLAVDESGMPSIAFLEDSGFVVIGADTLPLASWNRATPDGLALFDHHWGAATDSATGTVELVVAAPAEAARAVDGARRRTRRQGLLSGTASVVDTMPAGVATRDGQIVLVAGAAAPAALRARLLAAQPGDSVRVERWLEHRRVTGAQDSSESVNTTRSLPVRRTPREAVGGFPILVRRGVIASRLDSAGGPGFGPVRHPRTAVGISRGGSHLLLVTVDGRQPGYSVGMTLPELARLMLDLGASDALNLDGGGSTTMALTGGNDMTRILNQPSDTSGERPVSNALAVVRRCEESLREPGRPSGRVR